MTDDDRPMFAELMQMLSEAYGEALSRLRVEVYFLALCELPIDGVREACRQHIRSSKWFPTPAELRAMFVSAVPDLGAAFAELGTAMRLPVAYWREPPLPLYLAATVERLGGWFLVSRMDHDTLWHRFRAVYEPVRHAEIVRTSDARQIASEGPPRLGEVRALIGKVGQPI